MAAGAAYAAKLKYKYIICKPPPDAQAYRTCGNPRRPLGAVRLPTEGQGWHIFKLKKIFIILLV